MRYSIGQGDCNRNNRDKNHGAAATAEAGLGQLFVSNQRHSEISSLCQRIQIIQHRRKRTMRGVDIAISLFDAPKERKCWLF